MPHAGFLSQKFFYPLHHGVLPIVRVVAMVLALCAVLYVSIAPQVVNDFWLQAKVGELIVANGNIPRTVLFPFTEIKDAHFNAHEWLASVFFYFVLKLVGEVGLPFVLGFAGLAFFGIVAVMVVKRTRNNFALGLLLGLVAILTENYRHFLRPELCSLLLLGLFLYVIASLRLENRWRVSAALLIITVLWANIHGSFILAPMLLFAFAAGSWIDGLRQAKGWLTLREIDAHQLVSWKLFAAIGCASMMACLVNPFGVDQLVFVLTFSHSIVVKQQIAEWLPTFDSRFRGDAGLWLGMCCALLAATIMLFQWRRLRTGDVLIFLLFMFLAFSAIRFLVYVGMVSAWVLSGVSMHSLKGHRAQLMLYATVGVLSVSIIVASSIWGNAYGARPYRGISNEILSRNMLKAISAPETHGNVFNSYAFGAELVYRAYPRLRPSIDSRIDSYGDSYFLMHETLLQKESAFESFVTLYDVRYLLLNRRDLEQLKKRDDWKDGIWIVQVEDHKGAWLRRRDVTH